MLTSLKTALTLKFVSTQRLTLQQLINYITKPGQFSAHPVDFFFHKNFDLTNLGCSDTNYNPRNGVKFKFLSVKLSQTVWRGDTDPTDTPYYPPPSSFPHTL